MVRLPPLLALSCKQAQDRLHADVAFVAWERVPGSPHWQRWDLAHLTVLEPEQGASVRE